MTVYKKISIQGKGNRYMVSTALGRMQMIAERNIPANIVEMLRDTSTVDDTGLKLEGPMRRCVVCKERATVSRVINLQTIALCNEDYFNKTTGQLVQLLRGDRPSDTEDETKEGHETEDEQTVEDRVLTNA